MFSKQELQAIAILLQRVDIKGNEAISVAMLQQKIENLINPQLKPETDGKGETPEKEGRKS